MQPLHAPLDSFISKQENACHKPLHCRCRSKSLQISALLPGSSMASRADLCKPKIAKLNKALLVNEDIFRLKVPVHNGVVMQVLQRQHNAGYVEACKALFHSLQHLHLQPWSRSVLERSRRLRAFPRSFVLWATTATVCRRPCPPGQGLACLMKISTGQ